MSDRKEYFKKYREEHREIINKKARETYYKNKEERPEYEKQRRREWSNNKRKKDKENAELVIKYKNVLDKIKEYITSYESINTIQECEIPENNIGLDEETFIEMVNRYMKVHDKILKILEEIE